jgi:hypothetical protein
METNMKNQPSHAKQWRVRMRWSVVGGQRRLDNHLLHAKTVLTTI